MEKGRLRTGVRGAREGGGDPSRLRKPHHVMEATGQSRAMEEALGIHFGAFFCSIFLATFWGVVAMDGFMDQGGWRIFFITSPLSPNKFLLFSPYPFFGKEFRMFGPPLTSYVNDS